MKFIDLFSGLGGFHKALSTLGHQCVMACEINEELRILYHKNWGIYPEGDIKTLVNDNLNLIPDHDILCAGFPCQPFSQAGFRKGIQDSRGTLFDEIAIILNAKKPKYFILENVPHLSNHNNKKTWNMMSDKLKEIGYTIDLNVYSPFDFGIPQNRKRVFIVGSLNGLKNFSFDNIDKFKTDKINIYDFIDKEFDENLKLPKKNIECINVWQSFINNLPSNISIPKFPIWSMEFGATYPFDIPPTSLNSSQLSKYKGKFGVSLENKSKSEQISLLPNYSKKNKKFPNWKKKYIVQNREFYNLHKRSINEVLNSIINLEFETLQKLEWNVDNTNKNIRSYFLQFRPSGLRVKSSNCFPSLVTSATQVPVIGWQERYLSVDEALSLQSLENLKMPEHKTASMRSVGNAVNSKIVELIASELLKNEFKKESYKLELIG